ncbi:hypothetical protein IT570_06520 [Candidatus Sumerlaeota bacterium]|nr:hypothetical protein [Candidatus Sumerlaeota bacterium]
MELEVRIAYLERYCRRLTFAVAGLLIVTVAALLLSTAARSENNQQVITARGFIVENAEGRELIRIGESEAGPGAIVLRDSGGLTSARLEGTASNGGSLRLYGSEGRQRIILETGSEPGSHLTVLDGESRAVARLGDVGHGGSVDIYQGGRHVAFLCVDPRLGSGSLCLYDNQRRLMMAGHGDANGNGQIFTAKR